MKWAVTSLLALLLLAAAAQAPAPRIGVVDVNRLFENFHKTNQLDAELTKVSEKLGTEIKKLEGRIEKLRGELSLLVRGTDRYNEIEKQLFSLVQEHKFEMNKAKTAVQAKQVEFRDQILAELRAAVDAYGRQQGFTMILQKELSAAEGKGWRSVLYCADGVDITEAILARVNPSKD